MNSLEREFHFGTHPSKVGLGEGSLFVKLLACLLQGDKSKLLKNLRQTPSVRSVPFWEVFRILPFVAEMMTDTLPSLTQTHWVCPKYDLTFQAAQEPPKNASYTLRLIFVAVRVSFGSVKVA